MGFQSGLTGLSVFSKSLDVIGNNIANANTVAMKTSRTEYADLASKQVGGGSEVGFGVSVATVAQQFTQGNMSVTGNALDIAINGNGFFQVINPSGTKAYTRDGQFKVDKDGNLITNSGALVMGYKTDKLGIPSSPVLPTKMTVPTGAPIPASETKNIIAGFNLTNRAKGAAESTPPTPIATYGTTITTFDAQGSEIPVSLYFSRGLSIPADTLKGIPAKDVWYVYDNNNVAAGDLEIKETLANAEPQKAVVAAANDALNIAKLPETITTAITTVEANKTSSASDYSFASTAAPRTAFWVNDYFVTNGTFPTDAWINAKLALEGVTEPISGELMGKLQRAKMLADAAQLANDAALAADQAVKDSPLPEIAPKPTPHITKLFPSDGAMKAYESGIKPVAYIPASSTDVQIKFYSREADDDLQVFTKDGKHLIGTDFKDRVWTNNGIRTPGDVEKKVFSEAEFNPDAVYDGSQLLKGSSGKTLAGSYNGMNFTYSGDSFDFNKNYNESITIDQVTEDLFLFSVGRGWFDAGVSGTFPPSPNTPAPITKQSLIAEAGIKRAAAAKALKDAQAAAVSAKNAIVTAYNANNANSTLSQLVTATTVTVTKVADAIAAVEKTGVSDKTENLKGAISEQLALSDSDSRRTKALYKLEFTEDGKLIATYENGKDEFAGIFTPSETKGILSHTIDPSKSKPSSIVKPFNVSIDLSAATQFSDAFAVNKLTQDGYTSGSLTGLSVNSTGEIITNYSNGQTQVQGKLVLADFRNTQGLTNVGAGNYIETLLSGNPVIGVAGVGSFGTLRSGALEDSNVDLTKELVDMMIAQRSYQASAQNIKTQDQIMSTMVNIR